MVQMHHGLGRDLIIKGIDMQIWSENSVEVTSCMNNIIKLAHLISHTNNTERMKNIGDRPMLESNLANRAFSLFGGSDMIVWKFTSSGDYTVKTSYKLLNAQEISLDGRNRPSFRNIPVTS